MTWFLFQKGVFDDRSFVTLGIVFLSFLAIGAATYVFWKKLLTILDGCNEPTTAPGRKQRFTWSEVEWRLLVLCSHPCLSPPCGRRVGRRGRAHGALLQ